MKMLMVFYGLMFGLVNLFMPGLKDNGHGRWRYVALGDSYTICEGADRKASWPLLLTQHLNEAGIPAALVANPARTGWTTQNLIDFELPVLDTCNAGFVTLCIGVNDWVQGVSEKKFKANLVLILDHIQQKLADKNKILLLTIPDFSVTPQGKKYTGGRNASAGIMAFNALITGEAKQRGLPCVDLFEVSKAMKTDSSLVARDGLHPSAKEYAIWEQLIFPVVKNMVK